MKVGVEPLIGEKMVESRRMFDINYREAGSNSYYTAVHTRADGSREVYTRKSLASLMFFLRDKDVDFVVRPR